MSAQLPAIWRSFRFRIALLSTFLSGLVLITFFVGAWFLIRKVNLERMDEDIRRICLGPLSIPRRLDNWADFEKARKFILSEDHADAAVILIKDRAGELLYASPEWPAELPASLFPVPDLPEPDASFWEQRGGPGGPEPPEFFRFHDDHRGRWNERSGPEERRMGIGNGPLGPPPADPMEPGLADARRWERGRPFPRPLDVKTHPFFSAETANAEWRVGVMSNPYITFAFARDMSRFHGEMRSLRNYFLIDLPAALLLIAIGGWWVSQRALRPVRTLTAMAEGITAKGLDQRIPLSGENTEFNRLILVFNGMMDRLEKSFEQAVRFSADAAHELKTPLTILQGELEQALQAAAPESPQQASYSALLEEVQRLKSVIRKLLLLSLADSGQLKPNVERVDLTALIEEAIDDVDILAPDITVEKNLAEHLCVVADGDLLRQVVQNLVSNAVKYNDAHGAIHFHLRRKDGEIVFTVANTGPGIPPEDRGKVFERFYRADKARNRQVDGAGLGLSLAREIARAHGGDLVLEDMESGLTAFSLMLPIPAGPDGSAAPASDIQRA